MSKKRIATVSLAGCFGCHMSLLDIDERLLDLMQVADIDRSPLTDLKVFSQDCDIGLIEGGCCNEDNVEVLQEFRRRCEILVSVGHCAVTGGLPAMRNAIMHAKEPLRECLETAYGSSELVLNPGNQVPNDTALPLLLDKVYPCHEVVSIDLQIPGCPPSADTLYNTLFALIEHGLTGVHDETLLHQGIRYD